MTRGLRRQPELTRMAIALTGNPINTIQALASHIRQVPSQQEDAQKRSTHPNSNVSSASLTDLIMAGHISDISRRRCFYSPKSQTVLRNRRVERFSVHIPCYRNPKIANCRTRRRMAQQRSPHQALAVQVNENFNPDTAELSLRLATTEQEI